MLIDNSTREELYDIAKPKFTCDWCGNEIYEEDYYWNIDNEYVCEECIKDMRKQA